MTLGSGAMTNTIADIAEESQVIFIIGSNTTENHPVIGTKIRRAKRYRGTKLIVADPRRIDITRYADLHLQQKPGTDLALLNGLMHIILREGWEDEEYIRERTEGFEELKAVVSKYTPEFTSQITGVPVRILDSNQCIISSAHRRNGLPRRCATNARIL